MRNITSKRDDIFFIKAFAPPVPIRSVELVVHKHFVKKRILEDLQRIISEAVGGKLKRVNDGGLVRPV